MLSWRARLDNAHEETIKTSKLIIFLKVYILLIISAWCSLRLFRDDIS